MKKVGAFLHITPTVFIRPGTDKREGHGGVTWMKKPCTVGLLCNSDLKVGEAQKRKQPWAS